MKKNIICFIFILLGIAIIMVVWPMFYFIECGDTWMKKPAHLTSAVCFISGLSIIVGSIIWRGEQ